MSTAALVTGAQALLTLTTVMFERERQARPGSRGYRCGRSPTGTDRDRRSRWPRRRRSPACRRAAPAMFRSSAPGWCRQPAWDSSESRCTRPSGQRPRRQGAAPPLGGSSVFNPCRVMRSRLRTPLERGKSCGGRLSVKLHFTMDLRRMAVFATVVESGSMRRAAQRTRSDPVSCQPADSPARERDRGHAPTPDDTTAGAD